MDNAITLPNIFIRCGRPESLYRPVICFFFYSDVDYQGRVQVPWACFSTSPWEMNSGTFELSSLARTGNEDYHQGNLYNHFLLCVDHLVKNTRFGSFPVEIVYNKDDVELRNRTLGDAPYVPESEAHGSPFDTLAYRSVRRHSALQSILQWFCFNKKYVLKSESAVHHMAQFTGLEKPMFKDVEKRIVSMNHVLKNSARYSQSVVLSMAYSLGCDGRAAKFKEGS